jgi:transmembrane sensor
MVLIVAGTGWLFFEVAAPQKITVASSPDEKNIEVLLADGSTVYLNRDSRLTYPESFRGESRRVSLSGEAYFDIAPDTKHPFIIDAGKASVKVLGTSFNVITENAESEVEVYVASGQGDGYQRGRGTEPYPRAGVYRQGLGQQCLKRTQHKRKLPRLAY